MITSLVHPATAHLPPEEQRRGSYEFTSPEELSRIAAEARNSAGIAGTSTGRLTSEQPAMDPRIARSGRVVRRSKQAVSVGFEDFRALEIRLAAYLLVTAADEVIGRLQDYEVTNLFKLLADRLGYTVE